MLGATVMPHAIYAHSALARDRHGRVTDPSRVATVLRATRLDVGVALAGAGAVNLALLLLGAVVLFHTPDVSTLQGVGASLTRVVGPAVGALFAVGLLCSGIASTSVGCYAGSVVTEGVLRIRVPVVARRLVTAIPALVALFTGTDPTSLLVVSQVVLSFGIPLAMVPLVLLTARGSVMGDSVNRRVTTVAAAVGSAAVVGLNAVLIVMLLAGT